MVDTNGQILLNTLVNPRQPISPEATRLHNITDQMVAGAPAFPDALREVLLATAGRRVLAYNAPFDYGCLRSDAQRYDQNPEHLDDPDTWPHHAGAIGLGRQPRPRSPKTQDCTGEDPT